MEPLRKTLGIISSVLQSQNKPQGIRIRLENHFSPIGDNKTSQKFSKLFLIKSPVSRIEPKTLKSSMLYARSLRLTWDIPL